MGMAEPGCGGVRLGVRGFVLAGGASLRFGSNKARHPVDGEPMVCRTARALEEAGLATVLVVRDQDLLDLGIPLLLETDSGHGLHPLRGVLAALRSLPDGDSALIAPCDIPGLEASSVQRLVEGGAPAVAVDSKGRLHPLLAHLPRDWALQVEGVLARGGAVTEAMLDAKHISLPDAHLRNWNAPPG